MAGISRRKFLEDVGKYGVFIFGETEEDLEKIRSSGGVIYLRIEPVDPEYPARITHQLISTSSLDFSGMLAVVSDDKVRQRKYL